MNWGNKRKIPGLKNVGILGFGTIIGNSISVIFWLFLANLLGPEKYGEINYFVAIAMFASSISLISARRAIIVYTIKQIKIQSPMYLISICFSAGIALFIFLLYSDLGMSLIVVGFVIFNLIMAEFLGKKLYKTNSKFYVLQKIMFVFFATIFYFVLGPPGIILGIGLSYMPFFYFIFKTFREIPLDFSLFKNRLGFMTNNYLLWIIEKSRGQIDIFIIGPLFGFALLGNYSLAMQFFAVLTIFPSFIFKYTLSEDASGGGTNQIKLIAIIFSGGIALLGVFLAPSIILEIFPQFIESVDLIPIISLAIIPYTISIMYISKFLGEEKTKHVLISYIGILTVLISGIYISSETIGSQGLAISIVLAYLTGAVYLILANYSKNHS